MFLRAHSANAIRRRGRCRKSPRGPAQLWLEPLERRELLDSGLGKAADAQRFVTALYTGVLDRGPTTPELTAWSAAVQAGWSPVAVAALFTSSTEYRTDLITNDYLNLLNRMPSAGETAAWLGFLQSGLSDEQLTADFVATDEYFIGQGSTTTGWLSGVYQDVLGRSIDPVGLNALTTALNSGMTRLTAATLITTSTEAFQHDITTTYSELLGRAADPAALDAGTRALASGVSPAALTAAVAASPEFTLVQDPPMYGPNTPTQLTSARLDFGTATSPVAPGYTGVALVGYTAARGYGWQSIAGIYALDRGAADPLTRDMHVGASGTFLINLAAGTYAVRPMLGDPSVRHDGVAISLNGQQVASGLTTLSKQFQDSIYLVTVSGTSPLALGLQSAGGTVPTFAIAGLDIIPASSLPVANAGTGISVNEGSAVQFSGTATGGNGALSYNWTFGDGTAASGTLTPTHTYAGSGTFTATLTVTDAQGWVSHSTTVVTVAHVAPTANAGGPYAGFAGYAIRFIGGANDPDPTAQLSYAWNFGDGSSATGQDVSHTYAAAGPYTVTLSVADQTGAIGTSQSTVNVAAPHIVTIDSTWLAQNGPAPYVLGQANTIYQLATDVDVPGTAFVDGAANVLLDLGGHKVTYGDAAPLSLYNGGFELGSLPTVVPGWDLSQAPTAIREPARTGMWGNWMLHLGLFTTNQVLVSSAVTISAANREYAARVTVAGSNNVSQVLLEVLDTVTGQVIGQSTSPAPNRGFAAVVQFTPTTTDPVKLRVTISDSSGGLAQADVDNANVLYSRDWGIVASTSTWSWPPQLQQSRLTQAGANAANFTVQNGSLVQGQSRGYNGEALKATALVGLSVNNVSITTDGTNTDGIYAAYGANVSIQNSNIQSTTDDITDRMYIFAGIIMSALTGSADVEGNTILNVPQCGVMASYNPVGTSLTISGNTIRQRGIVSDDYSVLIDAVQNFHITNNTLEPFVGRGILLDAWTTTDFSRNGEIANNTITAYEKPNLEYTYNCLEATALRVRENLAGAFNLYIHDNTFFAQTDANGVWTAIGMRFSTGIRSVGANDRIVNNVFKAIVNLTDPHYGAIAVAMAGTASGTGLVVSNNIMESNDTSLTFGDNDSTPVDADILMVGNTMRLSSLGPVRPYTSIRFGDYGVTTSGIRLIDTHYVNGATPAWVYLGPLASKEIETGVLFSILARTASGAALPGATVQILNNSGAVVFTGMTDATGRVSGIPLSTTLYNQPSGDAINVTSSPLGPFTVRVTVGSSVVSKIFNPLVDASGLFTFA
jgi:PKD repeat protein